MSIKNNYVPLSDTAKQILFGSILGDGSLKKQKGYKNVRFQMRHSEQQAEYFHWKVKALQEIAGKNSVKEQKADGYSKAKKLRFLSRALPNLTELHELTYKRNKLYIRRKWLNLMDPLALTIWWCDDGSLISNSRKGVFCTDGFDKKSVITIARYLDKIWKIKTIVAPIKRKRNGRQDQYWRIWIRSTEELKKFLLIILPYIPVASMLSKTLLLYKNSQLQQRWISEIAKNSNFSYEIIEKIYHNKKQKWQKFRE